MHGFILGLGFRVGGGEVAPGRVPGGCFCNGEPRLQAGVQGTYGHMDFGSSSAAWCCAVVVCHMMEGNHNITHLSLTTRIVRCGTSMRWARVEACS